MVMLTRCNPTNDMMSHRMGRLFDEMLGNGSRRTAEERSLRGAWVPAINILEQDGAVLITADLPGLKAEDVEVTVDEGTLTIPASASSMRPRRVRPITVSSATMASSNVPSTCRPRSTAQRLRPASQTAR